MRKTTFHVSWDVKGVCNTGGVEVVKAVDIVAAIQAVQSDRPAARILEAKVAPRKRALR